MIAVSVRVTKNGLPGAAGKLRSGLPGVVAATTTDVATRAQGYSPVDTGELRASIAGQASGLSGTVAAGAEHGIYQEFGTSRQAGTPFMRPGAEAAFPGFETAVRSLLGGLA